MQPRQSTRLSFFVKKSESGGYFAVCLERYIAAQGRTVEEAVDRLRIVFRADLDESMKRTGEPFGHIARSPDKYHEQFHLGDVWELRGIMHDQNDPPLYRLPFWPDLVDVAA